jgi:hypothetical protein
MMPLRFDSTSALHGGVNVCNAIAVMAALFTQAPGMQTLGWLVAGGVGAGGGGCGSH